MKLAEKLLKVQAELKAPKSQYNSFGKYHYRNCEDILEAVKPLLLKNNLSLVINDEIVMIGDRFYVKASAEVYCPEEEKLITVSAYARESEDKKGMDSAQVTGAASSYARKYALNGLFLIDDTKDADTMQPEKEPAKQAKQEYVMVDTDGTKLLLTKKGYVGIGMLDKDVLIKMLASKLYEQARDEITEAINVCEA